MRAFDWYHSADLGRLEPRSGRFLRHFTQVPSSHRKLGQESGLVYKRVHTADETRQYSSVFSILRTTEN